MASTDQERIILISDILKDMQKIIKNLEIRITKLEEKEHYE